MAAAQVHKSHHGRHRSISDPFTDPTPHLAQVPRSAPIPPPKNAPPPRPPKPSRETYQDSAQTRSGDPSPRTRMHRSQTSVPPVAQDSRPPAGNSRSISQDSVVRAANSLEKNKAAGRRSGKKGSSHADVIDRLDFSGVGPMFHHDGPFDACAPSRNKHRAKAPMLAWSSGANADNAALANAYTPGVGDSPYPNARAGDVFVSPRVPYEAPKKKTYDALAEAWGIHEPEPYEEFFAGGGTNVSRPPSTHNGSRGGTPTATRREREREREYATRGSAEESSRGRREGKRSAIPPPQPIFVPEPEVGAYDGSGSNPPSPLASPGSPGNPNAPKRSKSLMQKIRKMRDAPNVPPSAYADDVPDSPPYAYDGGYGAYGPPPPASAPSPGRPGHRSQKSFLGRIGGAAPPPSASAGQERRFVAPVRAADVSPSAERGDVYVYIDDPREKALPAAPGDAPRTSNEGDYFGAGEDGRYAGGAAGLGRKTSLIKKAKGLMRGGK